MPDCIPLSGNILKQLQQIQLSILKDVASFCEENNIQYCLTSGTLLGAIRHGGFIPWDDDVDISMPREDYEKFISIAHKLPQQYEVVTTRLNNNYPIAISKVRKKGTVMKEPSMAHLNISHGVWIDIFPLDRVKNINKLGKRAHTFNLLTTVINHKLDVSHPQKITTRFICGVLCLFSISQIDKWRTKIMTVEEKTNGKFYTSFASNLGYKNLLFSEDVYFPFKKAKFEDGYFNIPNNADKWLTSAYGDYMTPPPPEKQVNRHKISEIKL